MIRHCLFLNLIDDYESATRNAFNKYLSIDKTALNSNIYKNHRTDNKIFLNTCIELQAKLTDFEFELAIDETFHKRKKTRTVNKANESIFNFKNVMKFVHAINESREIINEIMNCSGFELDDNDFIQLEKIKNEVVTHFKTLFENQIDVSIINNIIIEVFKIKLSFQYCISDEEKKSSKRNKNEEIESFNEFDFQDLLQQICNRDDFNCDDFDAVFEENLLTDNMKA